MKVIQLPLATNKPLRLIAILLLWLGPLCVFTQEETKRYDFEVDNQSLRIALERLGELTGRNFTYNSADQSFNRAVNYSATNLPLSQILEGLLNRSGHDYKRIGNQLVVFAREQAQQHEQALPAPTSDAPPVIQRDTILVMSPPQTVYDTVVRFETITQIDTLFIRDTVFIEKPAAAKVPAKGIRRISSDIFRFEPNREDGWAMSFSYAQYYGGTNNSADESHAALLNLADETESFSLRNYALGIGGLYNKGQWTFSAAMELSGFSNRFRYNDINSIGGYYQTDTISWYYTLQAADTIWFPVTDSSYLPLDYQEVRYNQLNRVGFLGLKLSTSYRLYQQEDFNVYLKAGLGGAVPIYMDGVLLQNSENFPGTDFSEKTFQSPLLFYETGAGMNYYLADWFDLYAELSYKHFLTPLISDYELERHMRAIGLRLGLIYYF